MPLDIRNTTVAGNPSEDYITMLYLESVGVVTRTDHRSDCSHWEISSSGRGACLLVYVLDRPRYHFHPRPDIPVTDLVVLAWVGARTQNAAATHCSIHAWLQKSMVFCWTKRFG